MSWTDFYPVFEDSHVADFQQFATPAEQAELEDWVGVARVINERPACRHRVAVSLFWKNLTSAEGELVVENREQMKDASKLGLISRYAPWEHYVEPLLAGAALLRRKRPEMVLRVYLAADLDFLVDDLVSASCEVMLMRSSSLRHNPGALWRFLALESTDEWITVIDADGCKDILADVERTEHTMAAGLGLWRKPYFFDPDHHTNDPGFYRPINACQFGAKGGQPIRLLLKAFIWHNRRGSMRTTWQEPAGHGKEQEQSIGGTSWPSYGFDEWFLLAALYPRLAFEGVLTFFDWMEPNLSFFHALDVEYATWANHRSEVFRCPNQPGTAPWELEVMKPVLKIREKTAVIRRERTLHGPAHSILQKPLENEVRTSLLSGVISQKCLAGWQIMYRTPTMWILIRVSSCESWGQNFSAIVVMERQM